LVLTQQTNIIDVKDMSTGVDKLLRKLFADKEIVFLAHNAKFEYMVLYKHFGIYVNFKDTFLLQADNGRS
jgi:ribonuclease D